MRRLPNIAILLGLSLVFSSAMADVTLAPVFQDHAILQRDQPLPVWGRAEPGERVTVDFRGQTVGATTDADGRWLVYLEPVRAQIEPADLTVTGKTTVVARDVLVGEVWLASGQSNMNRPVSSLPDAAAVIAKIDNPFIRHLNIDLTTAAAPAATVGTSGWLAASPANVGNFSAVAWFFSQELQRKLRVPVGIIHCSWGGTPVESWTDLRTLQSTPAWPAFNAQWQQIVADFPAQQAAVAAWEKAAAEAKATGREPAQPHPGMLQGPGTRFEPASLYNAMIAPLQPYALRGAIWYQGERNRFNPGEYGVVFPAMISAWRAQWGLGDFPFYFVQMPNYALPDDPSGRTWARLREAQTKALTLPNTGMAVTIDCGDPKDLHPQNKPTVGRRLAQIALAKTYKIPGDWTGPRFAAAIREGSAMRVTFEHVATGLIADGKPPQSFELAGPDRKFYPATATIERDTILVKTPQVREPVAVRYAWTNAPVANLFNGAGLPAAPFRSDDW